MASDGGGPEAWPDFPGAAGSRQVTVAVTVTWRLRAGASRSATVGNAPASLEMGYQLTVVRQGSSWDVRSIGALDQPQSPGPP